MALPRGFKIDDALLDALRQVESGGRGDAVSPAGAVGEYQFLPETAEELGIDPLDPKQAREGARQLLQSHLDRFGDPELALMAYHAGAGNVDRYARGEKSRVGPLTRAYPKKVFAAMGNRATDALPDVPGPRYSSDDDESSLGDATDLDFDLGDLDLDARKRAARLRAEAVAAGQKIPPGSIGYEGASAEDRDPEADLDAARGVRDLFVPQSPLDLGLMAAMGPGRVPVKAGLGALGMALEPSDAEAALGPNFAKRFFSPLVELVRNLDVKKPLTERAWRELLQPNPKTGKQARFRDRRTGLDHPVTPDEWEFARGDAVLKELDDWKKSQGLESTFTKEELANTLDEGYPGLETKELGNLPGDMTVAELARYRAFDNRVAAIQRGENAWPLSETERAEYDRLGNLYPNNRPALHPPQYSEYTLKGPRTEGSYQESLTKFERPGNAPEGLTQIEVNELVRLRTAEERGVRLTAEQIRRAADLEKRVSASESHGFTPRAAHFQSEPNLMAHSRADRRQTVDGLKARHVDELQSDWHQQARDAGGYQDRTPLTEDERVELGALQKRDRDFDGNAGEYMRWRESAEGQRYRDLLARAEGVVAENRPPPAPHRKNWHEVELKKQLAQAIEDGDEVLTWTTGDQQIERYKSALRQQVDKIDWVRRPNGKYDIMPMKGGRPVNSSSARSKLEGLSDKELEDTIGTEMARKIRESKGTNAEGQPVDQVTGTLQGDDLTVGGAGMRSFYDREVVETAKKLAKKYGGEYVKTELPGTVNPAANKRVALRDQPLVDSLSDAHRDTLWKNAIRGTRGAHRDISAIQPLIDAAKRARLSPLEIERLSQGVLEHSRSKFDNAYAALKFLLQKTKHPSHSVHAIKITPQMRELLAKTGGKFSLYADGGSVDELWPSWLDEEPAVGMASGGRAGKALLERMRRWLNELGGLPVSELPEEGYKLIEKTAPDSSRVLYHGTGDNKKVFAPRREPLFMTGEPGIAEAFARSSKRSGMDNRADPLVVPFLARNDDINLTIDARKYLKLMSKRERNKYPDAVKIDDLDPPPEYYYDRTPHPWKKEGVERAALPERRIPRVAKMTDGDLLQFLDVFDMIPISEALFKSRSPDFVKKTYQTSPRELRQHIKQEADVYADYDQYYAKDASSLRRWQDGGEVPGALELAGGGSIMRALLKRLGLASETPAMRRMTDEELVRPFAGEASSERQVVDELENPSRRELLFGRAKPELPPVEMVDEAASTRNLPALRDEALPLAELQGESFQGLSPLEQAARQAQRYEPNRRVFLQGATSLATMPKRLELLSDVAPKLVEAAKPKLVVPRSSVMKTLEDILSDHWEISKGSMGDPDLPKGGNVWDSVDLMDNIDALVAKKLDVPVEEVYKHFDAPTITHNRSALEDPFETIHVFVDDGIITSAKQGLEELAASVDLKPTEYKQLVKRLHGVDVEDSIREAIKLFKDGLRNGGRVRERAA